MGFFDSLFGDLFDFNGDGVTDLGEAYIGYSIISGEYEKEDSDDDDDD